MGNLNGKKVAILVTDGFEQVEMTKPREALEEAGAETKIVSPKSGQIQGMNHADKGDTFDVDPARCDPDGVPQFGLIAEQEEKVSPDLVVRDGDGRVNTVRYEAVNAMLLNEFLRSIAR